MLIISHFDTWRLMNVSSYKTYSSIMYCFTFANFYAHLYCLAEHCSQKFNLIFPSLSWSIYTFTRGECSTRHATWWFYHLSSITNFDAHVLCYQFHKIISITVLGLVSLTCNVRNSISSLPRDGSHFKRYSSAVCAAFFNLEYERHIWSQDSQRHKVTRQL